MRSWVWGAPVPSMVPGTQLMSSDSEWERSGDLAAITLVPLVSFALGPSLTSLCVEVIWGLVKMQIPRQQTWAAGLDSAPRHWMAAEHPQVVCPATGSPWYLPGMPSGGQGRVGLGMGMTEAGAEPGPTL